DTWCSTEINYKGDNNAKLNVAFIYTEEPLVGTATSKNSDDLRSGITLEPGLTVVIWATKEIGSLGMSANTYYSKTYKTNADLSSEEDWGDKSYDNMKLLWSAIYLAKKDLRDRSTQNVHPRAAIPMRASYTGTEITQTTENFKKLQENFSLKQLLKDVVNAL
ncbi:MAG: hypothetical protein J1F14_06710, partial [Treponema sp.]|nr:hypothetical protein [Treponema sp.]